jgi:hypothetical protein
MTTTRTPAANRFQPIDPQPDDAIEKPRTTFVLGLEDRCPLFGIML